MNPFRKIEPTRIRLESLKALPSEQVRHNPLHLPTARQYATRFEQLGWHGEEGMPPLLVTKTKTGLYLVDGFHRLEALKINKETHAWACVWEGSLLKGRWHGAQFNADHGLPLKSRDVRKMFRLFMDAGLHTTKEDGWIGYRGIAAALGGRVGRGTVYRWVDEDYSTLARLHAQPEGLKDNPRDIRRAPIERTPMLTTAEAVSQMIMAATTFNADDRKALAELLASLRDTLLNPPQKRSTGRKAA